MKHLVLSSAVVLLLLFTASGFAISEGFDDGTNNYPAGAMAFTPPDPITGSLSSDGGVPPSYSYGVDYYMFTAGAGVTYQVTATIGFLGEVDVDVEYPAGTVIASGSNPGNENFSFTTSAAGTYYVIAWQTFNPYTYTIYVAATAGVDDWALY